MGTDNLISIIIPVYNVSNYIQECLDSCVNQAYTNIEIIAINDGSNDGSGDILDTYALNDSRIKVIHQQNRGVEHARLSGIAVSRGNWLMFLDSDDCLFYDSCYILLNTAIETSCDVVAGNFSFNHDSTQIGNLKRQIMTNTEFVEIIITEKHTPSLWAKLFRKSLFNNIKGNSRNIKIGEDFLASLNALFYAEKVVIINKIVYYYRQREDSVINSPSISATNSRLFFLLAIEDTLQNYKIKLNLTTFEDLTALLFIREFFSYLRDSGKSDYEYTIIEKIKLRYIHNLFMLNHTPLWRKLIVKTYIRNQHIGHFLIVCFNLIKKVIKK